MESLMVRLSILLIARVQKLPNYHQLRLCIDLVVEKIAVTGIELVNAPNIFGSCKRPTPLTRRLDNLIKESCALRSQQIRMISKSSQIEHVHDEIISLVLDVIETHVQMVVPPAGRQPCGVIKVSPLLQNSTQDLSRPLRRCVNNHLKSITRTSDSIEQQTTHSAAQRSLRCKQKRQGARIEPEGFAAQPRARERGAATCATGSTRSLASMLVPDGDRCLFRIRADHGMRPRGQSEAF